MTAKGQEEEAVVGLGGSRDRREWRGISRSRVFEWRKGSGVSAAGCLLLSFGTKIAGCTDQRASLVDMVLAISRQLSARYAAASFPAIMMLHWTAVRTVGGPTNCWGKLKVQLEQQKVAAICCVIYKLRFQVRLPGASREMRMGCRCNRGTLAVYSFAAPRCPKKT